MGMDVVCYRLGLTGMERILLIMVTLTSHPNPNNPYPNPNPNANPDPKGPFDRCERVLTFITLILKEKEEM